MTIKCSKCGQTFNSLIVVRELALKELTNMLMPHFMKSHKVEFEEYQTKIGHATIGLVSYMGMKATASIPEDETWVNEWMDSLQDKIMEILGFDPEVEQIVDGKTDGVVQ